jgi:hypothetical protein
VHSLFPFHLPKLPFDKENMDPIKRFYLGQTVIAFLS